MRTTKTGLDYFPLDLDFFDDLKIKSVSSRWGVLGEIVALKLLVLIYRNGYFLPWSEDNLILFLSTLNVSTLRYNADIKEVVTDIINELVRKEFFDANIYHRYSILTSRGIQKRYFEAIKRRKGVELYRELLLQKCKCEHRVDIISLNDHMNAVEKPFMYVSKDEVLTFTPQRRVEESRVEERKGRNSDNVDMKGNDVDSVTRTQDSPPPPFSLLLKEGFYQPSEDDISEWEKTWPKVDILAALQDIEKKLKNNSDYRRGSEGQCKNQVSTWLKYASERGEYPKARPLPESKLKDKCSQCGGKDKLIVPGETVCTDCYGVVDMPESAVNALAKKAGAGMPSEDEQAQKAKLKKQAEGLKDG